MSGRHVLPFLVAAALLPAGPASGSSHREAPLTALDPAADATDVYAFRSWESDHDDQVVVIFNVNPLEVPAGGPNYYPMDNNVRYEIHIDNNGDANEDITFTFRFQNLYSPHLITTDDGTAVEVPFLYAQPGTISDVLDANQGRFEAYTLTVTDRRIGATPIPLTNDTDGGTMFFKPLDHVGTFVIPDYATYANRHIAAYSTLISGLTGRVFVGQRKDPFVVNLGEVFDLAVPSAEPSGNSHGAHNVTAFAMEVPIPFLTNNGANPIIGIWTTASRPQTRTLNLSPTSAGDAVLPPSPAEPLVQTSRLGMPLVNKLLIGLSAKDRFNNSHPSDDAVLFGQSFTNPAIAEIMGAPSAFRTDLQLFILTGLPGVNETGGVGDMLRLDTSVAPVPPEAQDPMGLLASPPDLAGFPNGRRPGDDAVDITLQVVQGILLGGPGPFDASDGVSPDPTAFLPTFPFLQVPGATDQDITCVTLQSSTSPERSTFEPVEEAFVDPHRSNRIDTPLTDDPLAYYLLEGNPPESPAKIETLLHSAGRLQVVVAGSCM